MTGAQAEQDRRTMRALLIIMIICAGGIVVLLAVSTIPIFRLFL